MTKSIKKNYLYNLIFQILSVILPLITTPYLSHVLGSEQIGVYGFTLSIVTYFVLAGSLGVSMYGQREIARLQNDPKKRTRAFWQINILKWIATGLSLIIYYFACIQNTDYGFYYKIFTLELFANSIDISWFYQGIEEFRITVIRNIIIKLLSLVCIFIFVKTPSDTGIYILIYCLSNLISNGYLWIILPRFIKRVPLRLKTAKKHLMPIFLMFLPQVAVQIYTVLDRTMLGAITGDMHEVGIYEQSNKINRAAQTFVTALGVVMLSRVASLSVSKKIDEIRAIISKAFHLVWLLALPMVAGIIAVAPNLVPWFLGDDFLNATQVLQIGSLLILAVGLNNVSGIQYLVATGKQNLFTISVIAGALVNAIGNLLLIPTLGAKGAIIFSVVAEFTILLIQLIMIRKTVRL
ncbi:flippase, partial [Candidatus Saccharibacteria bacterium]|nr:flippase [Candidatus Saccharibacteria bacterium]